MPQEARSVGPPVRGKRAGCAGRIALLVATWLLLELLSLPLFRLATGKAFSVAEPRARRQEITGGAAKSDGAAPAPPSLESAGWRSEHMLHPFLGFVRSPEPPEINDYGFYGPSPIIDGKPVARNDRTLLVAVVGGSFAAQMTSVAGAHLAAGLGRLPQFHGRQVQVFNLAMGGMKEPQQLATFTYFESLGAEFDLVLNVDGYNELMLSQKNLELGVFPFYSGLWHFHLAQLPDPEVSRLLARKALFDELRRGLATRAEAVSWSPLAGLLWSLSDRWLATRSDHQSVAIDRRVAWRAANPTAPPPAFVAGPPYRGRSADQALADFVSIWSRSSQVLQSFVESRGGRYFHFLQPNQFVLDSKPMSSGEAQLALSEIRNRQVIVRGYPLLRAAGADLVSAGTAFTDLTQIFRQREEPLYADSCCHLNARGYELTVDAIVEVLAKSPAATVPGAPQR
ncbi:MAG: hypothetical protein ABI639_04605 [Thermoanaerobaculia bacterium]